MTDTRIESWLAERKRIHAAATKGPWVAGDPEMCGDDRDIPQAAVFAGMRPITWDDHNGEVFKPEDSTAIVDAHNHLPALIATVEAVLGVLNENTPPDPCQPDDPAGMCPDCSLTGEIHRALEAARKRLERAHGAETERNEP